MNQQFNTHLKNYKSQKRMELQGTILLFSKYSSNCKKIFDMIQSSGVDFSFLQSLCIDNEKIRKRIKTGKVQISLVPTILCLYRNGTIEKYEGEHAFSWVENMMARLAPPPSENPQLNVDRMRELEQEEQEERARIEREAKLRRRKREQPPRQVRAKPKIRTPTGPEEDENGEEKSEREEDDDRGVVATSINDLPDVESLPNPNQEEEENDNNDRYISKPQPPRIRKGENEYEESEEFYRGDVPDFRREPANAIRDDTTTRKGPTSAAAKAEAMQRERDQFEAQMNSGSNRPLQPERSMKVRTTR